MSGRLSTEEQEDLLVIIGALYGSTRQFEAYTFAFNEQTVAAVEELLVALKECNANVQHVLVGAAGAGAFRRRGWLRRVLREVAKELQQEHVVLNGAACRNVIRATGVSRIIMTAR